MAITHDKLYVKSSIDIKHISSLKVTHTCNEHVDAVISGIVEISHKAIYSDWSGETVSIFGVDDTVNPQEIPLFTGIIVDVSFRETPERYTELTIQAKSMTYTMDILPKNRSFQELKNYTDIIDVVAQEESASIIYNLNNQVSAYPLIQYRETNWAFIKRLAAKSNASLIPNMNSGKADMYVGMPGGGRFVGDLLNITYTQFLDQKYYSEVGQREHKQVYESYSVSVPDIWQIGDYGAIDNKKLYVYSRELTLHRGELVCTYILGTECIFRHNTIYNEKLRGTSLLGTVLATEQEQVRLHLDIDEVQDMDTAYPYPWRPESGNAMYCMPQVGTCVALHFPQADEQYAIAINSVRSDEHLNPQLQDPQNRFFTTEHGKELRVLSHLLDWSTQFDGSRIGFGDENGLRMDSCQTINLQANGDINLSGKKSEVLAPKEISVVKKNIVQSTVLNFCNTVDTIGGTAKFSTTAGGGAIGKVTPPHMRKTKFQVKDIQDELLSAIPLDLGNRPASVVAAAGTLFGNAAFNVSPIAVRKIQQIASLDFRNQQSTPEVFTWSGKEELRPAISKALGNKPTKAVPSTDISTINAATLIGYHKSKKR